MVVSCFSSCLTDVATMGKVCDCFFFFCFFFWGGGGGGGGVYIQFIFHFVLLALNCASLGAL